MLDLQSCHDHVIDQDHSFIEVAAGMLRKVAKDYDLNADVLNGIVEPTYG